MLHRLQKNPSYMDLQEFHANKQNVDGLVILQPILKK